MITVLLAGIVMTIAYPAYANLQKRAKTTTTIADIRLIESKAETWYTVHNQYPASLDELGPVPLDPWGRPYEYLRMAGARVGQVRKDRSLHPLNTDFDLYSMGPDGRSASPLTASISQDDIIRAGNGRFIGVASTY
jgi:general secretion pathway protein G